MAETFLVRRLTEHETFDEVWLDAYSSNALKIDFEKTPCTSINARKHIQRAYYQ